MKIFTKETLINELLLISEKGWIRNARHGNQGGVGNTLEDLLGIEENNLPIANANEWELKTQRTKTTSLVTLMHCEPSPTAVKFVPQVLLPNYGWPHSQAGKKYPENELSFRQTIGANPTDRGFKVVIDREICKISISFDRRSTSSRHDNWLNNIEKRVGLSDLSPQPYWGFDDLLYKVGSKLKNCFFVQAEVEKRGGVEYYKYSSIKMLQKFNFNKFLTQIEAGNILIDFDARTGHNHGTKFRIRQKYFPELYELSTVIK